MTEHPILFSEAMVRAILEGRKTQFRRVVKPPGWVEEPYFIDEQGRLYLEGYADFTPTQLTCPYGKPGDLLRVRETCKLWLKVEHVRVERLQDMTWDALEAEGCLGDPPIDFRASWNDRNAKRGHPWRSNPWVWVVEFAKAEAPA